MCAKLWVPCCKEILNCPECDFDTYPNTWKVDLGVGGWTDDLCDGCNTISGEYEPELFTVATCLWRYVQDVICTGYFDAFQVWVIHRWTGFNDWLWEVEVTIDIATGTGFFDRAIATYRTTESTSNNCWDLGGQGVGNKISVPLFFEDVSDVCNGGLPDTIEIWVP